MDYKKRIETGAKLATVGARQEAVSNTVYVCVDKANNDFKFIPLEDIVLFAQTEKPMTLKEYINSLENTINGLSNQLQSLKNNQLILESNNQLLKKSVEALSDYIDKQRFL